MQKSLLILARQFSDVKTNWLATACELYESRTQLEEDCGTERIQIANWDLNTVVTTTVHKYL